MSRYRAVSAEAIRDLAPGCPFSCVVSGESMLPLLRPGDRVVARRRDPGETGDGETHLRLGDLVVVDLPDAGLVVHRLLWRGRTGLRTRGDGSETMDPAVDPSRVLGRVEEARRGEATLGIERLRRGWTRHLAAAALHRIGRRVALAIAGAGAGARGGAGA